MALAVVVLLLALVSPAAAETEVTVWHAMGGALGEKVKEITDAFKKAGLGPAQAPATWPELGDAGKKLQAAGLPCGFTTDWQSSIQLENLSAWHNVPFATRANGFGGLDTELRFNAPFHVKHI